MPCIMQRSWSWTQSVTGPSRRASGTARNAVKRVPAHRAWGSESARPRPVGHETTNVPGGRGTSPPSPRHLLQINPIPPTHLLRSLRGERLCPLLPFSRMVDLVSFCFHSGRHWSPSGLPLPRLHRAAQNENSNCRWAAVSDLNSNNGRTNAWNNLIKSAEIM